MVVMDGKMKITFNDVGNGQWQGGGQTKVQCQQWVGTVQWTTERAAMMDSDDGEGDGQWRGC